MGGREANIWEEDNEGEESREEHHLLLSPPSSSPQLPAISQEMWYQGYQAGARGRGGAGGQVPGYCYCLHFTISQ